MKIIINWSVVMENQNVNQNFFKKATKAQSKLRLALFGPSGAGKTFSALRIASGLGERIAAIDTERGSISKYANRFNFEVCELEEPTIENYIKLIEIANEYDVLIIDSLTHGWQELLEEIDLMAKTRFGGNTWAAWSEGTPKQKKMINALYRSKAHIIGTMRSKTEWTLTRDDKSGKTQPMRVGLAPEQGKGIEYEFDMLMEINPDHIATVIKDRTGKYQDKMIKRPDEEFGASLQVWLHEGEMPESQKILNEITACKTVEELEALKEKTRFSAKAGKFKKYELEDFARAFDAKMSVIRPEALVS